MVESRGQRLKVGILTDSELCGGMTRPFSNGVRMIGAWTWGDKRGIGPG